MAQEASDRVHTLGPVPNPTAALAQLTAPVRHWFQQRFGAPTPAQCLAWPAIGSSQDLLLCAPTGTGKTLAAFLPILGQLLDELTGAYSCLYITPLKALGNDVHRTLRRHLREMRPFLPAGTRVPRVGLRTGDTSARRRRSMLLEPPPILLTTPESLAILLSQPSQGEHFRNLRWVVVDEVHALATNKRGADLALSLERLTALTAGKLQRIGLSATCAPLDEAARFLAGAGRVCAVACVGESAPLQLTLEPLEATEAFLPQLLDRLEPELVFNRSTLIFTNTRSLAERLGWALRQRYPAWQDEIAVHHSALDLARRRSVERRFKQGRLRAVATSTSLELGIDIGPVDGVVLIHPPGGVVRLLQRVGRAGHEPARPRRGLVLTANRAELLEATVTIASSHAAQYEPIRVPVHPFDVLCQQLLGMAAERPWTADEAFTLVRRAAPYAELSRSDFQACLDYLSGCRGDGRTWLPARLAWHGEHFVIADARTARILRRNIGTILTEEQRGVRLLNRNDEFEPGPAVGELDHAFAERLQPGDRFVLDGRCLECRRTQGRELLVEEVVGRPRVPRWGGEGWALSSELAGRLYLFRLRAAEALRDGRLALEALLAREYGLAGRAIHDLCELFERQECFSEVPDASTCLVECVADEALTSYYVHTPLSRPANNALAHVCSRRLARSRGRTVTSLVADLGFALFVHDGTALGADDFRALLAAAAFDSDLDAALAESLALPERFRRVALTGLMLLRNPVGRRRRVGGADWAERRLFAQVRAQAPDFVLLRQAQSEVREACAASEARDFVEALPARTFRCRWLSGISPFVEGWTQLAPGPAEALEGPDEALRRLHAALTCVDAD